MICNIIKTLEGVYADEGSWIDDLGFDCSIYAADKTKFACKICGFSFILSLSDTGTDRILFIKEKMENHKCIGE